MTCIFLCGICTINLNAQSRIEADSLFAASNYFEASIAYERIIFAAENPEATWYATLQKIQCLKQQREFARAEVFVRMNLNNFSADSLRYRLQYEQALTAYLAGNFETAASVSELMLLSYPKHDFDRNLVVVRILSLNEIQQWDKAGELFAGNAEKLFQVRVSDPYLQLPHLKNKDKAQWLSTFIPGGGQFYAGKPLEAMVSILIQGAGIYYGIASFQAQYYFSAWLVGAGLFGSFHFGGVRRAEILVDQYNAKKVKSFNEAVKNLLL
ncbi:MAG: hypothetical protein ABI151_13585 [Chitinophagaceae bacterium]